MININTELENNEEWKYIDLFDIKKNMYMVSNFGNIKNCKTGKQLHPWLGKNGYMYVSLMQNNNTIKKIGMHVLVAKLFVPIPDDLKDIKEPIVPNHNDFDKTNNHYTNLTWMTYAMNNKWNMIYNHCKLGEKAPNSKITDAAVHTICNLLQENYSNMAIIKELNLPNDNYHKALITAIRTGKKWKHISCHYNITNKNTLRKNNNNYIEMICQLIEKDYSLKDMREELGVEDTKEEKAKFKKLVGFIRNRKCYKDISEKYTWWK